MAAAGVCRSSAREDLEKLSDRCSRLCPDLCDRGTTRFSPERSDSRGFLLSLMEWFGWENPGCFAASSSSWVSKAAMVLLHVTFVGVIFLFDANLIRKTREEPW